MLFDRPYIITELEQRWGIKLDPTEYLYHNDRLIGLDINRHLKTDIDLYPLYKITSIEYLFISNQGISDLRPLSTLTNIKSLKLSGNNIHDLSPLSALKNLKSLSLHKNNIYDLSPLSTLTNLTFLNLSTNQIENLEPISRLVNITELYLSENKISSIYHLIDYEELVHLFIGQNNITDIRPLLKLSKLELLYLNDNEISNIKPLAGLSKLKFLSIKKNKLETSRTLLPLLKLPLLETVNIDDNPVMKSLPAEEVMVGWVALKKYLLSMKTDSLIGIKEVKLLLLGNSNVGKSTLLHYLLHNTINPNISPTHGIKYYQLSDFFNGINIHVWDFGGQEYFHATHKLFFSPGALHIIVWNYNYIERENSNQDNSSFELNYWLRCTEQLCKNDQYDIDVLVTENKIEKNFPSLNNQRILESQYPSLRIAYTAINLKPPRRLDGFKELLKEHIEELSITKTKRPDYYLDYIEFIHNSKRKGKVFLLFSDFYGIQETKDDEELIVTMRVFHLMGFVLYFEDIIRDKVFIQPQSLLDLLYERVLDGEAKKNDGKISISKLINAINHNDLELNYEEVQKLLLHFDLIFKIPGEEYWFAPQYLPKEKQAWLDFVSKYLFSFANVYITSDSYLMNLALLKLFTEYGKLVKKKQVVDSNKSSGSIYTEYLFWRDGLVIEKDNQVLLVKFDRNKQALLLYGDKEAKNLQLQKKVISFIVRLAEENEVNNPSDSSTVFEELEDSTNEETWDTNKFTVNLAVNKDEYIPWRKLYQSKTSLIQHDGKTFLIRDFKNFLPNNKMAMKKIFISYSKADLTMVNHFIDHLAALQINGEVESWFCTDLKAGEKWEDTIQSHLDNADIICFMVSHSFMKTTYIHEHEIPRAIERTKKPNPPTIVPIVLDFCHWKTTSNNLQDFTTLPYTLKPIADFTNQNMAWYIVVEMLKLIIANPLNKSHSELLAKIPPDVRKIYERIVEGKVDKGGS